MSSESLRASANSDTALFYVREKEWFLADNRGRYFAKKPKNAQGGINSAQAKFPESPKKSVFTP